MGVAAAGREPPRFVGTVVPQWAPLCKALGRLGRRQGLQIVYEAGPCGYTLARQLRSHGYSCEVIAPAKVARRPGDRIKTDRRDALLLARAARAGELVNVTIPDERDEALRDLARSREDAVRARLKARQQLKALLLRHGHRYTGRSSWTAAHERYLSELSFAQPAQDIAFAEYRSAVREAHAAGGGATALTTNSRLFSPLVGRTNRTGADILTGTQKSEALQSRETYALLDMSHSRGTLERAMWASA